MLNFQLTGNTLCQQAFIHASTTLHVCIIADKIQKRKKYFHSIECLSHTHILTLTRTHAMHTSTFYILRCPKLMCIYFIGFIAHRQTHFYRHRLHRFSGIRGKIVTLFVCQVLLNERIKIPGSRQHSHTYSHTHSHE